MSDHSSAKPTQRARPPTATFDHDRAPDPESVAADLAGLPPRFKIIREIARGGMGVVLVANDEVLGREVAVKVVIGRDGEQAGDRERLVREAKAAAVLRHPGVVTVFDVDPDGRWIVMELVHGETLAKHLSSGPLPVAEVRRLGAELLAALAAAHAAGVVHRDVKPSNVLLDGGGRVRLADFGIASTVGAGLTQTGSVVGTPAYMAPEQLRGSPADARSDIYAVAATLFETATGQNPHAAIESGADLQAGVLEATGDESLASAITKGLARSPAHRFATALEFAAALAPVTRPIRRRVIGGLVIGGVAVAALAIVAASHLGPFSSASSDRQPSRTLGPVGPGTHVAVVPFSVTASDPRLDFAATGLANIIGEELGREPTLVVIGVHALVARASPGSKVDWRKLAVAAGATTIVEGTLVERAGQVELDVVLVAADGGEREHIHRTALVDKTAGAVRDAARDLAGAMLGKAPARAAGGDYALDIERQVQLGVAALEAGDLSTAEKDLGEVATRAPDHALVDYYLTLLTWWRSRPAAEVLVRADQALTGVLSPAQRRFIEGLRLLIQDRHRDAISHFEALVRDYPDDREAQYGLFEALFHGGAPSEAVAVYRRLGASYPRFALGGFHAAEFYVLRGDEAGLRWILERFEHVGYDERDTWLVRALITRREYGAARLKLDDMLARNPMVTDGRSLRRAVAVLEDDISGLRRLLVSPAVRDDHADLADRAGFAALSGDVSTRAEMSARLGQLARETPTERVRFEAWFALAMLELAPRGGDNGSIAGLVQISKDVPGVASRSDLARAVLAGQRADKLELDALATSAFPDVRAVVDAFRAEARGDLEAAADGWQRALDRAASGRVVIAERFHQARVRRAQNRPSDVVADCDEVIRPRYFDWAWAVAAPTCLAWTADAEIAQNHPDQARAAWRRLLALRGSAPASDPLIVSARRGLARLDATSR